MARNCILISIALLSANCLLLPTATFTSNLTTDTYALLALKAQVTSDPHNLLTTNWFTNTSVCNWIGVTCSAKHMRVTALNVSYFDLTATIPPQLGNLSFIQVLDFTNNRFHGSFPIDLTRLRRLKFINFQFNDFGTEIPPWFGTSFPILQRLSLQGNNFAGTIPVSLGNISSLQQLDLRFNQISGTLHS